MRTRWLAKLVTDVDSDCDFGSRLGYSVHGGLFLEAVCRATS